MSLIRRITALWPASPTFCVALALVLGSGATSSATAQRMPTTAAAVDLLICRHTELSEWDCGAASDASVSGVLADITSATVTSALRGGNSATRTFPAKADAMFFTRGAVSNFLLRYYRATSRTKATAVAKRLGLSGANAAQQARVAASSDEDACIHTELSEWDCLAAEPAARKMPLDSTSSRTLTVKLRNGTTITRTLPGNTDAIFLTRGAVSNFLLRYYLQTNKRKAAALTKRIAESAPKSAKK